MMALTLTCSKEAVTTLEAPVTGALREWRLQLHRRACPSGDKVQTLGLELDDL